MTRELLERIKDENEAVYKSIERLHSIDKKTVDHDSYLSERSGYLNALVNIGFITDRERQILFCYITL